jgi:hypothetical protein
MHFVGAVLYNGIWTLTFRGCVIPPYLGLYQRSKLLVLSYSERPPYVNEILFIINLHLIIPWHPKRRVTFPIIWEDSSENHVSLSEIYRKVTYYDFREFWCKLYKHSFLCTHRPSKLLPFTALLSSVYVHNIFAHGLRYSCAQWYTTENLL